MYLSMNMVVTKLYDHAESKAWMSNLKIFTRFIAWEITVKNINHITAGLSKMLSYQIDAC